jgi:hypothetical protein
LFPFGELEIASILSFPSLSSAAIPPPDSSAISTFSTLQFVDSSFLPELMPTSFTVVVRDVREPAALENAVREAEVLDFEEVG